MMQIDSKTGILSEVRQVNSPNFNDRPQDVEIDLLVVHNISLPPGEFGGDFIDAFFCNTLDAEAHPYFQEIHHLKTSCHCLIRREGEIVQYVPFTKRAWHAGASTFAGIEDCNNYSIGIELEGTDFVSYTHIQYETLAKLIRMLQKIYPSIKKERIVGHNTIAPTRKTDPGPSFDWNLLMQLLKSDDEKLMGDPSLRLG